MSSDSCRQAPVKGTASGIHWAPSSALADHRKGIVYWDSVVAASWDERKMCASAPGSHLLTAARTFGLLRRRQVKSHQLD
jgi:hypothetical protein